jgi:ParB-like nuclease domain
MREVVQIPVDKIVPDPDNPNEMDEAQMKGLRESFLEFGFLHPIIVDEDYMLCDGFHRVEVYKEFKQKTIPGYVFHFEAPEKRMLLRQIMNKLKGRHNLELDAVELQRLLDYDADRLQLMLNFGKDDMAELLETVEANKSYSNQMMEERDKENAEIMKDGNPTAHYADSYLHGNIKQIVAYFDNETYVKVMDMIRPMQKDLGLKNPTDLIYNLILYYDKMSRIYPIKPEDIVIVETPEKEAVQYT